MDAKRIRARKGTRSIIDGNVARWQYERTNKGRAEKIARALNLFNPPRWR